MEKDKIIDKILAEWAMRSPDGLVGGHDTPENMAMLNEILKEYVPKAAKEVSRFSAESLLNDKNFEPEIVNKIVSTAKEIFGQKINELEKIYDSMTPDQAVKFINNQGNSPTFSKFMVAIDDPSIRRLVKTQVGRGEFILSILIKGCKRAGQKSGDLILSDGSVIDVKELDKGGSGTFRVSLKAFGGGGFSRLRFPRAMNEFFSYCKSTPEAVEVLKKMVDEIGIKDQGRTKYKKFTLKLLEELDWDAVTSTAVRGMMDIMIHIQKMTPDEAEKAGLGNKVEFDIGDEEVLMSLDKIDQKDKNKILDPNTKSEPVTISVSQITDASNQIIIPQLKKLEIFARPTSEDTAFNPLTIAKDMFASMKHYSGGIIFYEQGVGYTYEPDLVKMKKPFLFYLYAQATVVFKRVQ